MAVTLSEVARHAGVSLATASRAVNGSVRTVGAELAAKVRASADALGYLPNAPAQALARAATANVGVLLHDIADPYFAAIARGVSDAAVEAGLLPLVVNTDGDPDTQVRGIRMLHAQRVRAIILAGSAHTDPAATRASDAALADYRSDGGRVATVTDHGPGYDAVLPGNRRGAAELTRALLDLGHRRFAVITGPQRLRVSADRLEGVREALAGAGVGLDGSAVQHVEFSRAAGAAAVGRLLDGPARRWPTAVLALSDICAVGALGELRRRGVDVPGRISVAGFDDVPFAADVAPALSTVRLPLEQLGSRAVRLALEAARPGERPVRAALAARVVLRDSTAPPPGPAARQ
ncbi:LacI family DNA-binding transcriptional regulator [Kitasatospora sp. NPDC058170]|uniref:LacI family DNA-binding transcriptional regulator n=1 Tax=Kitasatospora sp. NPDC058170 TaxID=3346364 RepID=UPI0036D8A49B